VRRPAAALFFVVVLACTQHMDRDRWQHMSQPEKQIYVRSLIGGEQTKNAKGGTGHRYARDPDGYVKRIDKAYSRGDKREPSLIFASLADCKR
jgi:hypothetical protein